MALLEVRGLSMAFGGLRAVQELDLAVQHGEIVGLIGPNGSGKTTVFNVISGLYRATAGRIAFDDGRTELVGRPPHAVTALGVARTFQNQRLFNQMSVLENVLVGMHCRTRAGPGGHPARAARRRAPSGSGRSSAARSCWPSSASACCRARTIRPRRLSYANRRRLEIARALATDAEAAAARRARRRHEPDREARAAARHRAHPRRAGSAILLIEHDMGLVQGICERVVVLDHGVKIAEGSFQEVRRNPGGAGSVSGAAACLG